MAEAKQEAEQVVEGLEALGFDVDDELTLSEDEEQQEVETTAEEEPAAQEEPKAQEGAVEAASEEGEEESDEEPDVLSAFDQMLSDLHKQASGGEAEESPKVDPRDAALERARQRERELLEQRIKDLEAMRHSGEEREKKPDTPKAPSVEDVFESEVQVLVDKGYDEDMVRDLLSVQNEGAKILLEQMRDQEIRPLQERLQKEAQQVEYNQQTQKQKTEFLTGLQNLALAGRTEQGLVREFVAEFQRDPERAFQATRLGKVFLLDWEPGSDALPPNLRSASAVEMAGRATAQMMERAVEAYRNQSARTSNNGESDSIDAQGGPPRRRSTRPRSSQPDASEIEAAIAKETFDAGDRFEDAHPWFQNLEDSFPK